MCLHCRCSTLVLNFSNPSRPTTENVSMLSFHFKCQKASVAPSLFCRETGPCGSSGGEGCPPGPTGPWSHRVPPARPDWRCLNGCRWSCSSSWTGCRCARCTSPWTASRTTTSCSPTWALFPPSPGAPTGAQLHLTPQPTSTSTWEHSSL